MSERRVLFTALVGSHNYNLNDETSDKDYKSFVIPTFDDLYKGEMYSDSRAGEEQDSTTHDIRKLTSLWWKANLNFLEVLYSKDVKLGGIMPVDWHDFKKIINMRERIATMNLPYLYNACVGMYYNKMKYLYKGTSGTKHLVEKFGYDTKQALHAYRILDFLARYYKFRDFQKAMVYSDDKERNFMLSIKRGKFSAEEFDQMIFQKKDEVDLLAYEFKKFPIDYEVKEELDQIIYDIVKREVVG